MAKKDLNVNKKLLPPDQDEDVLPDGVKVTSKIKIKARTQKDSNSVYYTIGDPSDLQALPDPGNFNPGRFVANIILSKDTSIDPAVEINIEITAADVQRAAGQNFKLAYHQGQYWVVWDGEFPCQTGFVQVTLSKVGDPGIGLAP
jgi:hypothetical protein